MTYSPETLELVANIMGPIGGFLAWCMFASSIPVLRHIMKMKGVGEYSYFPYLVQLLNCALWDIYAISQTIHGSNMVWAIVANVPGAIIAAASLSTFFLYCTKAQKMVVLTRCLVPVIVVVVFGVYVFASPGQQSTQIAGLVCLIINMIMYLGPVAGISGAIRTRSTEFLPLSLGVATVVNSIPWAGYGFALSNMNIWLPNICGIVFGATQLLVYFLLTKCASVQGNLNASIIDPSMQQFAISGNMFSLLAPTPGLRTVSTWGEPLAEESTDSLPVFCGVPRAVSEGALIKLPSGTFGKNPRAASLLDLEAAGRKTPVGGKIPLVAPISERPRT